MLPVLFTVTVPAGWGRPLVVAAAVAIGLARAVVLRAGPDDRGERPSLLEALRADGWFWGLLAAAVVVVLRSGALAGTLRLPLHTYGLLMALAFLLGVLLAQREARRRGQDPEKVADLAFWVLVAALAGSQVLYVLLNLEEFSGPRFFGAPPFQAVPRFLLVWRTGLVFYGGFIGAALAAFVYMRRHRMPFWAHADTIIPSVAFGHFLGRVGCFSAGCCWGGLARPDLRWAVHFPPGSSVYEAFAGGGYPRSFLTADGLATTALHPTQLYEALGELVLFFLLAYVIRPRKRFDGQLLASWLVAYSALRAVVEVFRGDLARHAYLGLNSGQWISVVILAAGLALWARAPRPVGGATV